jgi:hypothetical protein
MINAAINPNPLRSKVNFLPKIFISIGAVTIPTITSVVTKAEIVITVAPDRSNDPANGNATNEGIKVIAPSTAATIVAKNPASAPTRLEMVSGVNVPNVSPTIPNTAKRLGAVLRRAFPATLNAFFDFSLLFTRKQLSKPLKSHK